MNVIYIYHQHVLPEYCRWKRARAEKGALLMVSAEITTIYMQQSISCAAIDVVAIEDTFNCMVKGL